MAALSFYKSQTMALEFKSVFRTATNIGKNSANLSQKEDLAILCERHTTSKITEFEDLTSISTYGFRGEALASISHIAHLTVTTKTKDSALAWRAHYLDGRLVAPKPGQPAEPKGVAGRPGTQISVEDLFFNVPTRRRAFRSHADEFNKIIDMVGRYAIHSAGVGFSCKKAGEASTSLSIQTAATTNDRIRQIYGGNVANELLGISASDARWGFTSSGLVTNANYHIKKTTLVLFINHRSVESTHIKKAIEQVYSTFLPKGGHPFVYLSISIDPARIDVNVHPTKREVHFLNEDEIVQEICKNLEASLAAVDTSRTFQTQTLIPGARQVDPGDDEPNYSSKTPITSKKLRRYSNDLVRTDMSERKITSMFASAGVGESPVPNARFDEPMALPESIQYAETDRQFVPCRLSSIKQLKSEVRDETHNELTETFASHTFVGIVDEQRRLAAIQSGVRLFLVDYGHVCFEYFYQLGLNDFGNFGLLQFSPALNLRELLTAAAEVEKGSLKAANEDFDVDKIVEKAHNQLIERREMLQEYFSLEISPAGELLSIPLMVKGYTPSLAKLPRFLLRLGPFVNWNEEKACLESFLRELATFYVPEQLPPTPVSDDASSEKLLPELKVRRQHIRWAVEHIFFPSFKSRLVATKALMDGSVLEVANLKGLYRVFERC